jgi:glutamate/tyrosine decarboxylase-like PLP-dependent enzyme
MLTHDWETLLDGARREALRFLRELPGREIRPLATLEELRVDLGGSLPEAPSDPETVVATLAKAADRGLLATTSGRFFGFVIGGALPASVATEWLTAAWDQCAGFHALSPAAAVAEEVAASWLLELFGLPPDASVGFVTGAQMAHFTGLAAGRHAVLRRAGWDVETDGLVGAPPLTVVVGQERHATVDRTLRFLGLGTACLREAEADGQGRMRPDALAGALRGLSGPAIVCAQVGNLNTGALDPMSEICEIAHEHGAWVHVDGAFGLWAAASPSLRRLIRGVEGADSWATDAHKWLNVPYDSGIAICAHPEAHRAAMTAINTIASYYPQGAGRERDPMDWNPELSRRARGFALWTALRSLGASGVAELVDRCSMLARRFADALAGADGVRIVNDVVLNQVLVRFGDDDDLTRRTIAAIQREGTCWMAGATWRGMQVMRISVSNWSTDEEDVDRSVDAVLRCYGRERRQVRSQLGTR